MDIDQNNLPPEPTKLHNEEQLPPIPTNHELLSKSKFNARYWWMVAALVLNLVGIFITLPLLIILGSPPVMSSIWFYLIIIFDLVTIIVSIMPFFLKGKLRRYFLITSGILGFFLAEPLGLIAIIILEFVTHSDDF